MLMQNNLENTYTYNATSKPININLNNKSNRSNGSNISNNYISKNHNPINYQADNVKCYDGEINLINTLDNNKLYINDYKLDTICFDPSKFSPPDEWSIRLKNRIKNLNNNDCRYIDYLFDNK